MQASASSKLSPEASFMDAQHSDGVTVVSVITSIAVTQGVWLLLSLG